ncbi:MAG: tRNA (adenosine(37)-N6)-threonylcarbamoyltransferase complex ATPase subunit type 1 TsaE [Patescibacteria group bacterium]
MKYRSESVTQTQKIAAELARKLITLRFPPSPKLRWASAPGRATVVALEGELGAGKTTFAKAFAKALGVKQKLTSPTFVLMRAYHLSPKTYNQLVHIDCYRLKNYKDLLPLGIKKIIAEPGNIVLIEWAERVKPILPKKCIWVHMDHISQNERTIKITNS